MENKRLMSAKCRQSCRQLKASHSKAFTINVNKIYIYPFFIYLINYLCRRGYPMFLLTLVLKDIQHKGFKCQQQSFLNKLEKTVFGGAK